MPLLERNSILDLAYLLALTQALAIRQFLVTNLVKSSGSSLLRFRIPVQTLASSLANMGDFPFKDPAAARYKGPTLFVRGTQISYIPDDVFPAIGLFFPRFIIQDINCGHWVITERPEAFKQGIVPFSIRWLSDVNRSSCCELSEGPRKRVKLSLRVESWLLH